VKKIFISRPLEATSPILSMLQSHEVALEDRSLLNFTPVPFEAPDTRWLFFYSKTGVQMFNLHCPSHHYKVLTFGPATAQIHSTYGEVVAHADVNAGHAIQLMTSYDCLDNITFVCGKTSLRSVQKHPAIRGRKTQEVIVYSQHPDDSYTQQHYDIAIMTSPLNFQTFAKALSTADTYISIGSTTARAMKALGTDAIIADRPSEEGIAISLGNLLAR